MKNLSIKGVVLRNYRGTVAAAPLIFLKFTTFLELIVIISLPFKLMFLSLNGTTEVYSWLVILTPYQSLVPLVRIIMSGKP